LEEPSTLPGHSIGPAGILAAFAIQSLPLAGKVGSFFLDGSRRARRPEPAAAEIGNMIAKPTLQSGDAGATA
jgi:hypothetical protein